MGCRENDFFSLSGSTQCVYLVSIFIDWLLS